MGPMNENRSSTAWMIWAIVGAVVAWAVYHAVGLYQQKADIRRPLVLLGCFALFLGFWGVLLAYRRARTKP